MSQWKECNYEGLDPSEVHGLWNRIIDQIEFGYKRVLISGETSDNTPFKGAAHKCVNEVVDHYEEVLVQTVDAYTPPVPPWE
jgi:hypothetical protein